METRNPNDETPPSEDGDATDRNDQLPVRRLQTTDLLEAPREGARIVIEHGASVYFSTCRRIAQFLNRGK